MYWIEKPNKVNTYLPIKALWLMTLRNVCPWVQNWVRRHDQVLVKLVLFVCSFVESTFTQLISFTCMLSFRSCILLLGLASEVVHLILNRPFKIELLWHSLSLPKFCHVSNVHCNACTMHSAVYSLLICDKKDITYFVICTKQDS